MAKKRLFNEDYIYANILNQAEEAKTFLEKSLKNDEENTQLKAKLNSLYRIRNNAIALMLRQGYEVRGIFVVEADEKKHYLSLDIDGDVFEVDALAIKNILVGDYEQVLKEVYNEEKSEYDFNTLLSLKKPKQPKQPKKKVETNVESTPAPKVKKEEVLVEDVVQTNISETKKDTGVMDFDIADAFSEMTEGTSKEKAFYPIPEKKSKESDKIFSDLMPQFNDEIETAENENKEEDKTDTEELEITNDVIEDFDNITNEINENTKKAEKEEFSFFDGFGVTIESEDEKEIEPAEPVNKEETVAEPVTPTTEENNEEDFSVVEMPVEIAEEETTPAPVPAPVIENDNSSEKLPEISEEISEENTSSNNDMDDFFSGFGINITSEEDVKEEKVVEEEKPVKVVEEKVPEMVVAEKAKEIPEEKEEKISISDLKKEQEETPIIKIVKNQTVKDTMCPNCRAPISENDTICSSCGFDLTNPEITMAEMLEKDEEVHMDEDDIKSILEEIKREYEKAKREEEEAEEKARLEAEKAKKPEFDMSSAPKRYARDNFKNVKMYRPQESDPEKLKVELLYDVYTIRAVDPKITQEEIDKKIQNIMETKRLTSDQLLRIREEYENMPRKERLIKVYLFPLHIPENGNERFAEFAAYVIEDDTKVGYFASDFKKQGSLSVVTSTHNFRFLYNWEEGMPKTKFVPGPEKDNVIEASVAQVRPSDISAVGFGHPFITLKVEYIDGFESIELHALPLIEEPRTENGNVKCMFICDDKQEQKRDVLHSDKNSEAIKQFNNKDYKLSCKEDGDLISIKVDIID